MAAPPCDFFGAVCKCTSLFTYLLNTFIRQRVTADKYSIQLEIHRKQYSMIFDITGLKAMGL